MKRKFIITELAALCLALAALTGCNKKETSPVTGPVISFNAEDAFTKAVVTGVTDIQNDPAGIRVWDWHTSLAYPDGTHTFDAAGTQVTYSGGAWTYSPARYWLNGTYTFAAVYPSTVSGATYEAVSGGAPVLTVPAFDVTSQNDLLVAINNGPDGSGINGLTHPDYVTLDFKHVLSNVQLKLTLDEDDFFEPTEDGGKRQVGYAYVSIVGFNNISTTGTLTASGSSVQWGSYGNGQMRLNYTDNPLQVTLEKQDFFGEDGLLVIPQEFADKDGELYMRVVINNSIGSNSESITKEFKVLLASVIDEWLPNAKYIFEGVITQELMIEFNVIKVNNWQDEPLGGFIVN